MHRVCYTILLVLVLVLHHVVPYALSTAWRGWALYLFWVLLSTFWLLVTLAALRRWAKS